MLGRMLESKIVSFTDMSIEVTPCSELANPCQGHRSGMEGRPRPAIPCARLCLGTVLGPQGQQAEGNPFMYPFLGALITPFSYLKASPMPPAPLLAVR